MDSNNQPQTHITEKNHEIVSFFNDDSSFVFAYKKTEKLVAAVYLVSNLFPENEPMKYSLRKKAGELLSFIVNYKDVRGAALSDFVYTIKSHVLELVSLLEVAMIGGLVSKMNFSVLNTEFHNLVELLNESAVAHKDSSQTPISSTFFNVEKPVTFHRNVTSHVSHGGNQHLIHDNSGPHAVLKDTEEISKDGFKRTNRQNVILGIIKKKKEVTIKDIAQIIRDCSEKTIQRELISFMEAGVLKRVGERRWSKYSFA